jgi:hypothetical protein
MQALNTGGFVGVCPHLLNMVRFQRVQHKYLYILLFDHIQTLNIHQSPAKTLCMAELLRAELLRADLLRADLLRAELLRVGFRRRAELLRVGFRRRAELPRVGFLGMGPVTPPPDL